MLHLRKELGERETSDTIRALKNRVWDELVIHFDDPVSSNFKIGADLSPVIKIEG